MVDPHSSYSSLVIQEAEKLQNLDSEVHVFDYGSLFVSLYLRGRFIDDDARLLLKVTLSSFLNT